MRRYLSAILLVISLTACSTTPVSPEPAIPDSTETPGIPTSPPPTSTLPAAPSTVEPAPTPLPTDRPPAPPPEPVGPFPLARPILPPGREVIDPTYRFGTTQSGEREPHHGVEFLNSQGTPVVASADGTVLFAGDDFNGGPYSPKNWFAFYGKFVMLEHVFPGMEQPVYTLYGHLSEILVTQGESVETGQEIGRVGFTGAAVGSHLHFEVRFGGTTYADVQNPELWLQPQPGNGSLAGTIMERDGLPLPVFPLQLTNVDGDGATFYFSTYEEDGLSNRSPFSESFALGNLPPGTYRLSFVAYTLETHLVEIHPGELTFIEITIGASP